MMLEHANCAKMKLVHETHGVIERALAREMWRRLAPPLSAYFAFSARNSPCSRDIRLTTTIARNAAMKPGMIS